MPIYKIQKSQFSELISNLMKKNDIIAPVKKELVDFNVISNPNQIYLDKKSYFPAKKFILKQEPILKFSNNKFIPILPKQKPKIFIGLRKCDLNSIKHHDLIFVLDHDPYYENHRKNSLFIGIHCEKTCSKYCFCGSMELSDYHDLMLYDKKDYYLIETGSKQGLKFLSSNKNFFTKTSISLTKKDKQIKNSSRLKVKDISPFYDHKLWKSLVKECLSCAACTNLCPSCYCFELHDEFDLNLKDSKRIKKLSSCQLKSFTRIAGDHIFRDTREARFKHRIYHQLDYFKKQHGVNLCTGCGRCIESCPTRIDFIKALNKMQNGK